MFDFILNLFSTEGFLPKGTYGKAWTKDLIISSQIANFICIIGYAFTSIQMLRLLMLKRADIPVPRQITFFLLTIFPIICVFSRLGNIMVYKWAPYRFYITIEWLSALWVTLLAYRLRAATEYLISLPSHSQQMEINRLLNEEVKLRRRTQEELEELNKKLILVVEQLERMIKSEIWLQDKRETLEDLNKMLADIQRQL